MFLDFFGSDRAKRFRQRVFVIFGEYPIDYVPELLVRQRYLGRSGYANKISSTFCREGKRAKLVP